MIESPAYYASKRRMDDAERVLNIVSLQNTGKPFTFLHFDDSKSLTVEIGESEQPRKNIKYLIKKLFSKQFKLTSILLALVLYI